MMSTTSILPQFAFVVVLLTFSAFFSGSEAALFSLPPAVVQRLQATRSGPAQAVTRLLKSSQALLITILLGNLVVNLLATSRATELLVAALGDRAGSWVAWIGMSMVILISGEITPKVLAVQHCEFWALFSGRIMYVLCIVLAPVRILLVRAVAPLTAGWYGNQRRLLLERAEFQTAVQEAAEVGSVHPFEGDVVLALLDLEETRVREVMTPRVLIRGLPADTPVDELPRLVRRLRRTRLPVFNGSVDTTIGILRIHDLAGIQVGGPARTAGQLSAPALFVPENLTVDRLLLRFHSEGHDIAMVVDEFGSVAGLVTIQDVVDELFGPIPDRHDPALPVMVLAGDGSWLLPGDFPIEGLEKALDIHVDDPLVETVGGRITHVLGRIPASGESVVLPEGLTVRVTRASPRRVIEISVARSADRVLS